jgi:diaminopimelate epimerase
MKLNFTKMQGAGNDFVVLDATAAALNLSTQQLMHLGDRRLGIGADQILVVEPPSSAEFDFRYRIFNGANGQEVAHCGNGARCFVRFVLDQGLSQKTTLRVQTMNRTLVLQAQSDGRVKVDMGLPSFEPAALPFETANLHPHMVHAALVFALNVASCEPLIVAVSMGNPHAVLLVPDVQTAPVSTQGPAIEQHAQFPQGVNVGFMQVIGRNHIALRVYERGAGETLSCGTGACAAAAAGQQLGLLDTDVAVDTRGGRLHIHWQGPGTSMYMTGPATTVFQGEIEL